MIFELQTTQIHFWFLLPTVVFESFFLIARLTNGFVSQRIATQNQYFIEIRLFFIGTTFTYGKDLKFTIEKFPGAILDVRHFDPLSHTTLFDTDANLFATIDRIGHHPVTQERVEVDDLCHF